METAWQYLSSHRGQTYEKSYPYSAKAGPCKFPSASMAIGAKISSKYTELIAEKDTNAMMTMLSKGKILTVGFSVPGSFFNYKYNMTENILEM